MTSPEDMIKTCGGIVIINGKATIFENNDKMEMMMPEELTVYRNGPVYCSVCTNITSRRRIEELLNQKNPTGISSMWGFSANKNFASGDPNPCPCEKKPTTHTHYLMSC